MKIILFNMANVGRKISVSKHIHNVIIEFHNKGYSVRNIAQYIKEELDFNISKTTVQRVISNYKRSNEKTNKVVDEAKQVLIQKAKPAKKILIVNKGNECGQTEVVSKAMPVITDRIYMDYMEELEKSDLIKALRTRYLPIARKHSMNFRQYLEYACELEKQYLEKEVVIAGSKAHNEPDIKEILEAAVLGKIIKGL